MEKYKISYVKSRSLKYQLQYRITNLSCAKDLILYQIFKIILSISSKNMKKYKLIANTNIYQQN